jgi:hypothetical protein
VRAAAHRAPTGRGGGSRAVRSRAGSRREACGVLRFAFKLRLRHAERDTPNSPEAHVVDAPSGRP